MARKVLIEIDLDELSSMISESVQQCLAVHRLQLAVDGRVLTPDEAVMHWREVGNNVAGILALQEPEST